MKILQICFAPIVNSNGGAEKVYCNMSNHFIKENEVIDVCCDQAIGKPSYKLDERVRFVNLGESCDLKVPFKIKMYNEIVRLYKKSGRGVEFPKEVYKRNKISIALKTLLEEEKPDVAICYELRSMVAIAETGYDLNKVVVMFHMNADVITKQMSTKQKDVLKKVRVIQVLLESDKVKLGKLGYDNVVCIGNVVPEYAGDNNVTREKVIIHVGRLDRIQKRQHLLIEAFAKIRDSFPDWKVKFYGGDSVPKNYESELNVLIKKYQLENNVFLMGKSNKIPEELMKASIFAFPSAYEGFPLAMTEAMACGLPVVGFKQTPSVNEIIRDGVNGVLCDDNVEDFSKALKLLMHNFILSKKYGEQASKDMQCFSEKIIYKKWDVLLNIL